MQIEQPRAVAHQYDSRLQFSAPTAGGVLVPPAVSTTQINWFKIMKRFIARVTVNGVVHRFPVYAETYDIANRKLKELYPSELRRLGRIRCIISPYQS